MLSITKAEWCYYTARILITVITFILICRFVCRTTETIFTRDTKELYVIGFLPTAYYISDYTFTKLSDILYSSNKLIVESMGFALCIFYFAFLFIYFHQYEKKQEISNTYEDTVITAYIKNQMVNSVISIYHTRFEENGILFQYNINVSTPLPCSDTAICMILSNALENSINALKQIDTQEMDTEKKWVRLSISQKGEHLLLQIENPVVKIPKFVVGIPTSNRKGHGIGVKKY